MSEYGCHYCGHKPKKLPYGAKRNLHWCSNCDKGHSMPVNKKRARKSGIEEIVKQRVDEEKEQRLNDMIEREEFRKKLRF